MNVHNPLLGKAQVDLTLGSIRSAVNRIDEIRQELINAGLALKAGYISPQQAIDWAETFAPGCVGYIPPLSGLSTKQAEALNGRGQHSHIQAETIPDAAINDRCLLVPGPDQRAGQVKGVARGSPHGRADAAQNL
jgi:hypothetical protein